MRKLLIVAGLLLAGCGGEPSSAEKFKGEEARIAAVIEDIQTAGERRDPEKMCRDLVSKALRDKLGEVGSSCDKEIEKALEDADAFDLEVEKVTVSGTTAEVAVRGEAGEAKRSATVSMVKEDGRWRAASFSPAS
jgi:S-adenosylmethionine synthetase